MGGTPLTLTLANGKLSGTPLTLTLTLTLGADRGDRCAGLGAGDNRAPHGRRGQLLDGLPPPAARGECVVQGVYTQHTGVYTRSMHAVYTQYTRSILVVYTQYAR